MKLFNNLNDHIGFHARVRGDMMMASDSVKSLNYGEAWDYINTIAAHIQSGGISKGDRVAILAKNSVDNLCVFLACARIGAVVVGLNYRLAPAEVEFIASNADVEMLFFDKEFDELRGEYLRSKPCVCLDSAEPAPLLENWLQSPANLNEVEINGDDILFQMYTSGTTGLPKGVLVSHYNVLANTYQAPMTTGVGGRVGEVALVIAPTFHAVGLVGSLLGVIYGGSMIIHRDYDPVGMIETLAKERISTVAVIPVMLQFSLAMVPNIKDYDFSALHSINYGASPISETLLQQGMEAFGCDFIQGYGQTESTMALTFLTAEDHKKALAGRPELLRSCGRAVFGTEVKIVGDDGQELPLGEIGEIVAKGPQVMQGYWKNPEATAKTVADGWLHTGDAGRMDEEGYIYIQDRVKDMIISGGENIYPAEIENVLMAHSQIQDVSIIGVPDQKWGEIPLAVIVSGGQPELSAEELIEFCRGKLAGYKIPRKVEYLDALPRNPTGKVLKKDIRVMMAEKYPPIA
ncbi:Long-chain-fatty-acid--CoA ligase FadD13 [Zhongshania aliphaticivorans]|uniref:Long-chain-fatty-acid--CoA ligase FadD13 n=1 Tax=Zhongshania aliphaticivorans TaxID=1470434 RepID=A0A5S9N8J7_9GAMM|nr:long-chain-fatty-acid--CoA ligase [Zhongshania aliphaticivorans]CAA0079014.1 Long-chain-fatty-acid--CoA ligase FadD13 [Zhongshania aliphaticivorans]CAA0086326.1 Long-chain-fatty-acid--CoA ligase FadD13 [Zhongshania aliphaticivorans]